MNEISEKIKEYNENDLLNESMIESPLEMLVNKRKRKRGQNKNRKIVLEKEAIQLCPRISVGNQCEYDHSCKFIHSIEDYLSQKPHDIGDVCYVFNTRGRCNSGWKCRWLSGHVLKPTSDVKTWSLVVDHNV